MPGKIKFGRQRDVVYPAYLATSGTGEKAWIEQPSGCRQGWCVSLAGFDAGAPEARTMWFGRFKEAKQYAVELLS